MFCFINIYIILFSIIKPTLLSGKQDKKKITGHLCKWSVWTWNIWTFKWKSTKLLIDFHVVLHNLLAEIGSILQDVIQLWIFIICFNKKGPEGYIVWEKCWKFFKIMRCFWFNRVFKGWFSTRVKNKK